MNPIEEKYINDDGSIKDGTKVIIVNKEYVDDEINDSLVGTSAVVKNCSSVYGDEIYIIYVFGYIEKICFRANIEVDYSYYRNGKIDNILNG